MGFIVLDRPNPFGGIKIEDPLLEPGQVSFVSRFPISYMYGLICDELAKYLNEEGLLKENKKCKLQRITMEGWNRSMIFQETDLPWNLTSPHIPNSTNAIYATSGILGKNCILFRLVSVTLNHLNYSLQNELMLMI